MDYAHRRRVKIWGEARVVDDDPALLASLMPAGYKARPEQVILFKIAAWDTNCPQHIPQKFDAADVAAALASRDARIAELEAELAALKGASPSRSRRFRPPGLQRHPGEIRIILQHHAVDIGDRFPNCSARSRRFEVKNGVRIPASAPNAVASVPQGASPIR